jgi:hypothetical protein
MFLKHQAIEAFFDESWYRGIIHKLNENGTYVVHFDDGEILDDMREDEIRIPKTEKPVIVQDDDDDPFGDPFGDDFKGFRLAIKYFD